MDMTPTYWEDNSNIQRVKYESCNSTDESTRMKEERYPCCDTNLNFSTATCSEDDCEYGPYKKNKVARQDPMSHRIIEKRRRDRMNNCLADLSRLIPTEYLKKGRGRIEKTEIIEMAIKHMKYLQKEHENFVEHYSLGYQECMSEAMRFMVEVEGHFPREAICVRLLNHLQKHCESISRAPHTAQTDTATAEHNLSLSDQHKTIIRNADTSNNGQDKVCGYQMPKTEPEQNNNNNNNINNNGFIVRPHNNNTTPSSESDYEKHTESNGVSYKYKTNIKLRFNQDINAHEASPNRQIIENGRRNSITSIGNQSSSHSSPPSSELCTRISDTENTNQHSPFDSASISNGLLKVDAPKNYNLQRCPPDIKIQPENKIKNNFNVPVFVLHAKGSYYVPLTIDYQTLLPFLHNYDILEVVPTMHNIVLHPVTINVNFLPNFSHESVHGKYKSEYNNSH